MRSLVVVVRAARLWGRHWPVLLALSLLGTSGRAGALWAATDLSASHHALGVAVLMFAPLSAVAAIVAMLHALRGSLPALAVADEAKAPDDVDTHQQRHLVDVLASVLVPFLAVYAAWGFLSADAHQFVNAATVDEIFNNASALRGTSSYDPNRTAFATGWVAAGVIAVALVIRFGLGRLEGKASWRALGFVGAYVEVFWLATFAVVLTGYKDDVWTWVEGRRGYSILASWWQTLVDSIGPLGRPVDAIGAWVLSVIGSAETVVILPLAWLAVGVVVYGHKLAEPPAPDWPDRFPGVRRLPPLGRRWTAKVTSEVLDRFIALGAGVRQLVLGGLGPMLVFVVVFLASRRLEQGLDLVARQLIGPRSLDTWITLDPAVSGVSHAITMTVTVVLLAAVVDWVLEGAVLAVPSGPEAAGPEPVTGEAAPLPASDSPVAATRAPQL